MAAAQKRAVWGNDEVTAAKNDEALEAEAEDGDQESGAQPEDESSGAEPRKWARTRGTPKKVPLGQEKQHVFTDRRKQRYIYWSLDIISKFYLLAPNYCGVLFQRKKTRKSHNCIKISGLTSPIYVGGYL